MARPFRIEYPDTFYHILIETPDPDLFAGIRQLNGVYTRSVNRRHGTGGHILQGRFRPILVKKESHLLELCRYIVLNPARAGMTPSCIQKRIEAATTNRRRRT